MTDAELMAMVQRRKKAWTITTASRRRLADMSEAERLKADNWSGIYWDYDARIKAELVRRDRPVEFGGVILSLTAGRSGFVEIDPATRRPPGYARHDGFTEGCLYDYAPAKGGAA